MTVNDAVQIRYKDENKRTSTDTSNQFQLLDNSDDTVENTFSLSFENIQNISQDELEKIFQEDKNSLEKAIMLKKLSQKTNDDILNKIIFDKANNMEIADIKILSFVLDESSSIDRFSGIILSPEDLDGLDSNSNSISSNKLLLNSYEDSYEFLNSTIEHLDTSYKNNKFMLQPEEAEISEKFTELFKDIKDEYIDVIDDDKSLLGEYMRTINPLIIEETKEIEENAQLEIAMEIYGLDSSSSLQKFEYELIEKGYSREEARERASLYSQAGLLGSDYIYLTAFCDDETINRAIQTNPVGYLLKPFKNAELKSTILLAIYKSKQVEQKRFLNNEYSSIGDDYFYDDKNEDLYYKDNKINLTIKESHLLNILFKSKGNIVSFETLEHQIWEDNIVSSGALRTLLYRLRSKLEYKKIETVSTQGCRLII